MMISAISESPTGESTHKAIESEDVGAYQSMSRAGVAGLILSIMGLASFLWAPLITLPILGFAFGIVALRNIRKYPNEVLGYEITQAAIALSLITLVIAPIYHTVIYMTEVPEGYERVDFAVLKTRLDQPDAPTQAAIDLNGQQVFIKGYIHPSSMDSYQAQKFVLVPDLGTCCFGGQPRLTDMIEVTLSDDLYATKGYRRQRLAGKFHVNSSLKPIQELTGVYYQLKADVIK